MKKALLLVSFLSLVFLGFSQSISVSSLKKSSYCHGDTVWFTYTTSGVFDSSNSFKVEIGPSSGMFFSSPIYLGEKASSAIGLDSIAVVVPSSFPGNLTEMAYRVVSTSPVILGNTVQSVFMYQNPVFAFLSSDTVFCITEKALSLTISSQGLTAKFYGMGVSNNSFLPSIAGAGYHYLYCKVTDANACSSVDSLKIKVNTTSKPTVLSNEFITPYTTQTVYAFGDSLTWYTDSILTQFLYKGGIFDYLIPNSDTGAHYLYTTQKQNGCESEATKISVIYRPKNTVILCMAKKPTLDYMSASMCEGETSVNSIKAHYTNFNKIEWMDGSNPAVANVVANDSVFLFQKQNSPGSWIYYAYEHDTIDECYSLGAEFTFVVNPKPILSISIADTVCYSTQSIQITASPLGGLLSGVGIQPDNTFHPGSTRIQNTTVPISYTYSNSKGCSAKLVKKVFIRYVYLPTAMDMTGYLDSIPELFALGDDTNSVVSWYSDLTQPAIHVGEYYSPKPTALGEYTYFVSQVSKDCPSDIVPVKLKIIAGSGTITEIVKGNELNVYPIPTRDVLTLSDVTDGTVDVFTLQGIKVLTKTVIDNKVSLKELPTGMYIIQVPIGDNILGTKIIKE
jgi:hypothetical protein